MSRVRGSEVLREAHLGGRNARQKLLAIETCGDTQEYWRFCLERDRARRYDSRPRETVAEAA